VDGHLLHKRIQECYREIGWNILNYACDLCDNEIDPRKLHWHCSVCNKGNYDICIECHEKGKKCEDPSHVLAKQDRWGNILP
jgi:hypothetical protein